MRALAGGVVVSGLAACSGAFGAQTPATGDSAGVGAPNNSAEVAPSAGAEPAGSAPAMGVPSGGPSAAGGPAAPGSGAAAPRVLVAGTSLTAGLGLDPSRAYPAVLQRKADSAGYRVRIVNAGLSGETSAGALRRVDWVLRGPADAFVLETGANDGLRGLDVDSTRANITAVLRRVRAARPGAALFLVQMEAPPNMGPDYTRRFREIYPAVARAEGATLIPFLLADVAGRAALNQADGIHPTAAGARRVAETLWAVLGPVFQQLDASVHRA